MDMNDVAARQVLSKLAGTDPPKIDPKTGLPETKHRIRVVSRPMHQVIPGGLVNRGETFLIVWASDLKEIRKLVEDATDEDMAAVRAEFDRRQKRWLEKNPDADAGAESPHSLEACFEHVMGRAMRPLIEVEVLG